MKLWQIKKLLEDDVKFNCIEQAISIDCDNIIQDYQLFPESVHLKNAIYVKDNYNGFDSICKFIETLLYHNFYIGPYSHEIDELNGPPNNFKFIQAKNAFESFIQV